MVKLYRVYDRIMLRFLGVMPMLVSKVDEIEEKKHWVCVEM